MNGCIYIDTPGRARRIPQRAPYGLLDGVLSCCYSRSDFVINHVYVFPLKRLYPFVVCPSEIHGHIRCGKRKYHYQ